MPKSSAPEQVLPAAWTEVLTQVEHALAQAVQAAATREQALPAEAEPDGQRGAAWQDELSRLNDRLRALPERVRRAEEQAAEVDTLLGTGVEAAAAYRAAVQTTARKLANWDVHSLR